MIVTLFPEFSLQCINNSYLLNIGWLQRHYVFKYSPNDPIRYILYSPIVKIRKLRFREGKYLRKSTQLLRGGAKLKPTSLIPQHVILTNMLHSVCVCVCVCAWYSVIQSWTTLCNPIDYIAHKVPLSLEVSRQE